MAADFSSSRGEPARSDAVERLLRPSPCIMCAPMVRGSELAFRMLVRRHGVRACYTPMIKADNLVAGAEEERSLLDSCKDDRPLVVQLAGRDPGILAEAVGIVRKTLGDAIDAVDLNLGCPQECAQEGGYGAFLQEEPDVAAACVRAMCRAASPLPIFCKLRILDSVKASISYAQNLERAGCSLLAVHCRLRAVKHNGPADFEHLRHIVESLRIPVVANGGLATREECRRALAQTGAAAAMAATPLLRSPRAFDASGDGSELPNPAETALEYLDLAEQYPPPSPLYVRRHLRWLFRAHLQEAYTSARQGWLEGEGAGQADWRARTWHFLEQPCLDGIWQFRELVRYVAHHQGWPISLVVDRVLSLREIRMGRPELKEDSDEEFLTEWLFDAG